MRTGVTVESESNKPVHTFNSRRAEYRSSECKPAAAELAQERVRHEVAAWRGKVRRPRQLPRVQESRVIMKPVAMVDYMLQAGETLLASDQRRFDLTVGQSRGEDPP